MRPGRCIPLVCIPSAEKRRTFRKMSAENRTNRPTWLSAVLMSFVKQIKKFVEKDNISNALADTRPKFPTSAYCPPSLYTSAYIRAIWESLFCNRTGEGGTPLGRYVPPLPTVCHKDWAA